MEPTETKPISPITRPGIGGESGGNRGGLGPDSRVIALRGFNPINSIVVVKCQTTNKPLNATLASQRSIIRRETNDSTSSRVTTASSVALSDFVLRTVSRLNCSLDERKGAA